MKGIIQAEVSEYRYLSYKIRNLPLHIPGFMLLQHISCNIVIHFKIHI